MNYNFDRDTIQKVLVRKPPGLNKHKYDIQMSIRHVLLHFLSIKNAGPFRGLFSI